MLKMMVAGNPTLRIYPRDLTVKTRRINYDPVLKLYYYKVTETQIRDPQKVLAGIYGGMGVLNARRIIVSARLCVVNDGHDLQCSRVLQNKITVLVLRVSL